MSQDDLYEALGVPRTASQDEIRSAYRRLARQHHPDVNPGNRQAEERFKTVSAAFEVLSDAKKRQLYDEFGPESMRPGFDAEKARAYRSWTGRGGFESRGFGGGTRLEDLFGSIFSGGGGWSVDGGADFPGAGPRRARQGQNVEASVAISLRDAILGGEKELRVSRGGSSRTLKVKVPPGIEDGQRIRLAGQGNSGIGGAPPGDLLLLVAIESHPLVTRSGNNLCMTVPITIPEAISGARIEIPTFTGVLTVSLPKGSQGGSVLRLRGKGAPAHGGQPAGDLLITLQLCLPDGLADHAAAQTLVDTLTPLYSHDVRRELEI